MTSSTRTSPFLEQLPTPSVVFEIGAHRGQDIEEMRRLWPNARIIGFEAEPTNYGILEKRFHGFPNIRVEHMALCNRVGEIEFHKWYDDEDVPNEAIVENESLYNKTGQGSLLEMSDHMKKLFRVSGSPDTRKVPCSTLDVYIKSTGLVPDLITMDVQGGEGLVIEGGYGVLKNPQLLHVVLEWAEKGKELYTGEWGRQKIVDTMKDFGFVEKEVYHQLKGISGDSLFGRNKSLPNGRT